MSAIRPSSFFLFLLGFTIILTGCDLFGNLPPDPWLEEHFFYAASGKGTLTRTDDRLVFASGTTDSRFAIRKKPALPEAYEAVDLYFQVAPLAKGETFVIETETSDAEKAFEIHHRRNTDDDRTLTAIAHPGFGKVTALAVKRDGEILLYRSLSEDETTDTLTVGTTDREPSSYHEETVRDDHGNESTIITVDYEDSEGMYQEPGSTQLVITDGEEQMTVTATHISFFVDRRSQASMTDLYMHGSEMVELFRTAQGPEVSSKSYRRSFPR